MAKAIVNGNPAVTSASNDPTSNDTYTVKVTGRRKDDGH